MTTLKYLVDYQTAQTDLGPLSVCDKSIRSPTQIEHWRIMGKKFLADKKLTYQAILSKG